MPHRHQHFTVLQVEDQEAWCASVRDMLWQLKAEGWNFDVVAVGTLTEALDVLRSFEFSVIILDLELPDATRTMSVKAVHDAYPELPIVVYSSTPPAEIDRDVIAAGAQDYLHKNQWLTGEVLARSLYYAIERNKHRVAIMRANSELKQQIAEISSVAHVIPQSEAQARLFESVNDLTEMAQRLGALA